MGPYGSVGAHIKTGKRSMAPDHFQTPPDPKKGYTNQKKPKQIQKMLRKYFPSTVSEVCRFDRVQPRIQSMLRKYLPSTVPWPPCCSSKSSRSLVM